MMSLQDEKQGFHWNEITKQEGYVSKKNVKCYYGLQRLHFP